MPKLTPNNSNYINIPLSQIKETGNVRKEYNQEKIEELAKSILKNGLLNPLTVKRTDSVDEYGNALYELVCGHRRKRALEYLCSQGNDFNNVTVFIKQGSKSRMQLIENIQRENLSPEETEAALRQMLDEGMTQTEISQEISKPISWISDYLAGAHVRDIAESAGIKTDGIGSKALSQLRSIPESEIPSAVEILKDNGGTVKKATELKNQKKTAEEKQADQILKEPKPITMQVETAIEIISNYMHRQEKIIQDRGGQYAADKECQLHVICNDLISLFEAY